MRQHSNGRMSMAFIGLIVVFFIGAVSVLPVSPASIAFAAEKGKKLSYTLTPAMDSVQVTWKKPRQKVSYYLIYRTEYRVKDIYDIEPVPMSQFRRVAKVSGAKGAWTDRFVQEGVYYNYVVRGYRKTGGKAELVCDSFNPNATYYHCPGLQQPELINGGYGENFSNSKSTLYLYVQYTDGVMPYGVEVCRRAKDEAGWQQVNVRKAEEGWGECGGTYVDATVEPGKTYEYRVRTYVWRFDGAKYSPYSDVLEMETTNFKGRYTADAITPAGLTEDFTVRLDSDRYNGVLTLAGVYHEEEPIYSFRTTAKDYGNQTIALTACSKDNKTWQPIPSEGLRIKAGQTVFLKFRFADGTGYFGGAAGEESTIDFMYGNADYDGTAGFGATQMTISLKEGNATAFCDYDN